MTDLRECQICFDDEIPAEEMHHTGCHHEFCIECWNGFLQTQLDSNDEREEKKLYFFCPYPNCSQFVKKNFIVEYGNDYVKNKFLSLVKDHEILPISNMIELAETKLEEDNKKEKIWDFKLSSSTDYYHYECLCEPDTGWGCTYRCLQMLMSNLRLKGSTVKKGEDEVFEVEPSVYEIQTVLSKAETENYFNETDVGGGKWIGPGEMSGYFKYFNYDSFYITDELTMEFKEQVQTVENDLFLRLSEHFTNARTPITVTNGKKTYSIAGVRKKLKPNSDEIIGIDVLLLDPHFSENLNYSHFENRDNSSFIESVEMLSDDEALSLLRGIRRENDSDNNNNNNNNQEKELAEKRKELMLKHGICWVNYFHFFSSSPYWQLFWFNVDN
eukprot:TRINITY_DN985_c1_g3_i1.p1 TRINITY_DN985_c1_g3~~TRINITY_DN985_c1_g3_i1.p1  ORF type:complete len:398 (+),score=136.89 TRINITY_DN985_c1_g3_i1:42-1196(+)